jgi:methylated-DNA-[protein]-cysteine S-methyltransferase
MSSLEAILRDSAGLDERSAADGRGQPAVPPFVVPEGTDVVSYCVEDSPVGRLLLARTGRGLVRVAYLRGGREDTTPGLHERDEVLQDLADRISPRVLEQIPALDDTRRELDEFFGGTRTDFDLVLDWQLSDGFTRKVLRATAAIPYGEHSTYKGVAAAAGSANAFRAAGTALGKNPIPIIVPCHRVLHSGGGLGGYTGGLERKLTLLRIEGFA